MACFESSSINGSIFEGLFVLETANNYWGKVDRGVRIILDFGRVI